MVEVEKEIENCNFKKNFADNELNYQVMRKVQCGVLRLNQCWNFSFFLGIYFIVESLKIKGEVPFKKSSQSSAKRFNDLSFDMKWIINERLSSL